MVKASFARAAEIGAGADALNIFGTPGASLLSGTVTIKTAGGDGVTPFNSITGLDGIDNELAVHARRTARNLKHI